MKPFPEPTIPKKILKRILKTLLIFVDDKGGVGKSANCAHFIDVLWKHGYTVRIGDADHVNRTLQQLIPGKAIPVDTRKIGGLIDFIIQTAESNEDVSVLDMPGTSSGLLLQDGVEITKYAEAGVRIVVVINLTQTIDASLGAREWIKTLGPKVDYFVVANEKDTPNGENFNADAVPGLVGIINTTGGKMAVIPKFSPIMLGHYGRQKSHPTGYLSGGHAAEKLNINLVYSGIWQGHFQKVMGEFAPHIEWLTALPIPLTEEPYEITAAEETEATQRMADLFATLDGLLPVAAPSNQSES